MLPATSVFLLMKLKIIDTGATRICINETFYNQLMLPQLLKAFCLSVTSVYNNTLYPMGIAQCPFKLGGNSFEFNFNICQNLTRPMILGVDLMQRYQIRLSWSDTGKGLLTLEDKILVETVGICDIGPQLVIYPSPTLAPRMLTTINIHVDFKGSSAEHTYEVRPNSLLMNQ